MALGIAMAMDFFALGTEAIVFDDLVQISRCDPGLTATQPTDNLSSAGGFKFPVTIHYSQKKQSVPSSSRLLALVNHSDPVIIAGVDSTFVFEGGIPITNVAGATVQRPFGGPLVVYDVTEANGMGYYCYDKDGNEIDSPRPVSLYHELAHAFHIIQGDLPMSVAQAELQAETDENAFRSQLGLSLRDPLNHAGGARTFGAPQETFPRCDLPGSTWGLGRICLVASAATGSEFSSQVDALRTARAKYKDLSLWVSLIADPALEAYSRFSPDVVSDMESDPSLKAAMLTLAVQPVVHLVSVAEAIFRSEGRLAEVEDLVTGEFNAYLGEAGRAGATAETIMTAADDAAWAGQMLRGEVRSASIDPSSPSGVYSYLAGVIRSHQGPYDTFSWALSGIELFLRKAAQSTVAREPAVSQFVDCAAAWLAQLPIPKDGPLSLEIAADELKIFKGTIFADAAMRGQFAKHLESLWPRPDDPGLQDLLQSLEYVQIDR